MNEIISKTYGYRGGSRRFAHTHTTLSASLTSSLILSRKANTPVLNTTLRQTCGLLLWTSGAGSIWPICMQDVVEKHRSMCDSVSTSGEPTIYTLPSFASSMP